MSRKKVVFIISGFTSLIFILLTVLGGLYFQVSGLKEFCYIFHVIPFGLSYTEGLNAWVYLYYIALWFFVSLGMYIVINTYLIVNNK